MAIPSVTAISPAASAFRRSWFLKFLSIGFLLLLLHIPLAMTHGVLRERQRYQAQTVDEISGTWGREQTVIGPVLAVPYTYRGTVSRNRLVNGQSVHVDETASIAAVAYFLPETLDVAATLDPELRRRGIYDVAVYAARLKLSGSFRPDFTATGIDAEHIDWGKARLLIGFSDLHGLRSISPLRSNEGRENGFEPAPSAAGASLPLAAVAPLAGPGAVLPFVLEAVIQGSGTMRVSPVGKTTDVRLKSSWASPSFTGAWLPVRREVSTAGFDATWSIAHFSRNFPQSWTSRGAAESETLRRIEAAGFGVRLARGVDGYGVVERAQKYGVLFFVLVFAVFFLFEMTAAPRIHPAQYAMVGAGLCLFFLGFLALSEFWSIGAAYATASGACTAMVSLYSWSFLKSGARTLVIASGLGATYAYLYFVLKSQDYALIAGTAALFLVLGLTMFFTRRINWYALERNPAVGTAAP